MGVLLAFSLFFFFNTKESTFWLMDGEWVDSPHTHISSADTKDLFCPPDHSFFEIFYVLKQECPRSLSGGHMM